MGGRGGGARSNEGTGQCSGTMPAGLIIDYNADDNWKTKGGGLGIRGSERGRVRKIQSHTVLVYRNYLHHPSLC